MSEYDHLDADQERDRARDALADQIAATEAWAWVLSSPNGRFVLAAILRASGFFGASHTPGDPLSTAHREGQRSIGQAVFLAGMNADPATMLRVQRDVLAGTREDA